jgi:hypothetical protein
MNGDFVIYWDFIYRCAVIRKWVILICLSVHFAVAQLKLGYFIIFVLNNASKELKNVRGGTLAL